MFTIYNIPQTLTRIREEAFVGQPHKQTALGETIENYKLRVPGWLQVHDTNLWPNPNVSLHIPDAWKATHTFPTPASPTRIYFKT